MRRPLTTKLDAAKAEARRAARASSSGAWQLRNWTAAFQQAAGQMVLVTGSMGPPASATGSPSGPYRGGIAAAELDIHEADPQRGGLRGGNRATGGCRQPMMAALQPPPDAACRVNMTEHDPASSEQKLACLEGTGCLGGGRREGHALREGDCRQVAIMPCQPRMVRRRGMPSATDRDAIVFGVTAPKAATCMYVCVVG